MIIIALSVLGGLWAYYSYDVYDIWRIEYEFYSNNTIESDSFILKDTTILFHGLVARNYTGSISDTSKHLGLKRQEIKFYALKGSDKKFIYKSGSDILKNSSAKVYNVRFIKTYRNYEIIIRYILTGLAIAGFWKFVSSVFKKVASTKKINTEVDGL